MLAKNLFIALATAGLASLTASQGWAVTAATSTTSTSTTTASTSTVSSPGAASELLVTRYSKLAGSTANSQSLVTGLRNGTLVTLAPSATAPAGTPVVSFTPATQKMGFGNIKIALSLAKTTLAKQGITNPTPAQLAAALNGGNVTLTNGTVVTLAGVLTQRAAGMGWGKIAQTSGVKLGTVVSASKTDDNNTRKEDKKITLAKARDSVKDLDKDDNSKNRSATGDDRTSHVKSSNSSSSSANSTSSGNSGGGSSHSSNSGGSKSNSGGGSSGSNSGSNSGGNGGGNSGNSGGGNSGGNGGGGKK